MLYSTLRMKKSTSSVFDERTAAADPVGRRRMTQQGVPRNFSRDGGGARHVQRPSPPSNQLQQPTYYPTLRGSVDDGSQADPRSPTAAPKPVAQPKYADPEVKNSVMLRRSSTGGTIEHHPLTYNHTPGVPTYPAYGGGRGSQRCSSPVSKGTAVKSPQTTSITGGSRDAKRPHDSILRAMDRQLEHLGVLNTLNCVDISPDRSVFRGWRVVSLLGSGTFASVYKLENMKTGETAAAKLLEPQKFGASTQRRVVEMFAKEIRYFAECQCPGVVRLKRVLRGTEGWMLLQELVEGGTLWEDFETKDELEAFSLFVQLLQSLMFMQSKRVVHRDLKPTNILRSTDKKRVLVTDFGWSETYGDLNLHTHELPGTIEINPPEVLGHTTGQTEKIDNYALAMNMMLLMSRQFVCREKCLSTSDAAKRVLSKIASIRSGKALPGFSRDAWDVFLGLSDFNAHKRLTLPEVLRTRWFITMLGRLVAQLSRAECTQLLLSSSVTVNQGAAGTLWHGPVRQLAAQVWRSRYPPVHRPPRIPAGDYDDPVPDEFSSASALSAEQQTLTASDASDTTTITDQLHDEPTTTDDGEDDGDSLLGSPLRHNKRLPKTEVFSTREKRCDKSRTSPHLEELSLPRTEYSDLSTCELQSSGRDVTFDRQRAQQHCNATKSEARDPYVGAINAKKLGGRRSTTTTVSTTGSLDSLSSCPKKDPSGYDGDLFGHHHDTSRRSSVASLQPGLPVATITYAPPAASGSSSTQRRHSVLSSSKYRSRDPLTVSPSLRDDTVYISHPRKTIASPQRDNKTLLDSSLTPVHRRSPVIQRLCVSPLKPETKTVSTASPMYRNLLWRDAEPKRRSSVTAGLTPFVPRPSQYLGRPGLPRPETLYLHRPAAHVTPPAAQPRLRSRETARRISIL